MSAQARSGKYICLACRRPFDPTSPGATATMGPTCAKRAISTPGEDQLSMLELSGESAALAVTAAPAPKHRVTARKQLPSSLTNSYLAAKLAFSELYRLYCGNGSLKYGAEAEAREEILSTHELEPHSLRDPLLPWLEPEHNVCLMVDPDQGMIYLRRIINGVPSFLEISLDAEGPALEHRDTIIAHSRAMRDHGHAAGAVQLSLF